MVEERTKLLHSPKSPKQSLNPVVKRPIRNTSSSPSRNQGQKKEQTLTKRAPGSPEKESKQCASRMQGSPPKIKCSPKPVAKERTTKAEKLFRLHSEERAIQGASFDSMVIEEEEINLMRKEMVPKALLMPIFDRPFYPHRSTRPLTVPKEPSFLKQKCCIGGEFHRHFCFNTKAIR